MKALRNFIIFVVVLIVAIPVGVGGAALIKDDTVPAYLQNFDPATYDVHNTLDNLVNSEAVSLLGNKQIHIDEQTVNKIIYASVYKQVDGGFNNLVLQAGNQDILLKGVWVHFNDNTLSVYALYTYKGVTTTATVQIGFSQVSDGIQLTLENAKIGKMPIPDSVFSFLLNALQNYGNFNIQSQYPYGTVDINNLNVTITYSSIKSLIAQYLNNNYVSISDITLQNGEFIVTLALDDSNPQAKALDETITNVKQVITNKDFVTTINQYPELSAINDPNKTQFTTDLQTALTNTIIPLLNNSDATPADYQAAADSINTLATDFQNLKPATQQAVADAIVSQLDPTVVQNFENQILNNSSNTDLASILQQILGTQATN